MRRSILPAVLCAISFTAPLLADPPAPVITKLQVQKKSPEDLDVNLFGNEGVRFVLQISLPGQNILGVDEDASKLVSAVDDKGTDLAEDSSEWISGFFSRISKSRQKIAVPIALSTLPADGATSIAFKATIALHCGSDEKTEEIKPIDLANGTSAKFGKHTIEIKSSKDTGFEKDRQALSVTLSEGARWVKTIEFLDAAGQTLEAKENGSAGANDSIDKDYSLDADAKLASVRVTYFQKIEKVMQTIDMKVSIGLAK